MQLSPKTLLVEKWLEQCATVYLIWLKKVIENRDKPKITKHLIFPICFVKGDNFQIYTNLINSKLISELVSSDKSVFLCFNATQVWPIPISITIFLAHAQLQNSVNLALNTKRNITQTSKETNWWSFDESFAGCLGNIIKL